jgi:DNA-binding NtrC family response regulator
VRRGLGADADVLMVDFFDSIRNSTCSMLRRLGFTVVEADNGDRAYELLTENHYGMVLLDVDLPFRSGVELLESIEDLPPVVVYTAIRRQLPEYETFTDKIVEYLRKPVQPSLLAQVVMSVLGTRLPLR